MNFKAFQSTTTKVVTALAAVASAVILGSCGGSGAAGSNTGSSLQMLPSGGTFYAGVAYEFQVAGGVIPYILGSSEPDILPVPSTMTGHSFSVIPNQPGVVDAGLAPGSLPGRTVIITVRDKNGALFTSPSTRGIFVAQNFFTGYGVGYSSTCVAGGGGSAPQACPGGDSILQAIAVTNGRLFAGRQFRFEVVRGPFGWLDCDPTQTTNNPTAVPVNTLTCTTDHEGKANVRLRTQIGAATQLASFRIVDVATGSVTTHVFTISGNVGGTMTLIPDSLTLTGALSTRCGQGPGGVLIFDGAPPYTAISSNGQFQVTVTGNQLTILGSGICDKGTITVLDSGGRRATLDVESVAGATSPPDLTVSPTTVAMNNQCGFSYSAAVVGGAGALSAISSHPRVGAVISGNTLSIGRAGSGDLAAVYPTSGQISVTDGTKIVTITLTAIAPNCP